MVISVLAESAAASSDLRRVFPLGTAFVPCVDLTMWLAMAAAVDCSVVQFSSEPQPAAIARVRDAARDGRHPLVVVVDSPPHPGLRCVRGGPGMLVDGAQRLAIRGAVEEACTFSALAKLHEAVSTRPDASPAICAAAQVLCRRGAPVRGVAELATAAGYHRRTLWRGWQQIPASPSIRLEDLVDWVLLLRAATMRTQSRTWTSIATLFQVDRHSVPRIARRLMNLKEEKDPVGFASAVRRAFLRTVVSAIRA
jgi:hypothetical protein